MDVPSLSAQKPKDPNPSVWHPAHTLQDAPSNFIVAKAMHFFQLSCQDHFVPIKREKQSAPGGHLAQENSSPISWCLAN